MMSLRWASQLLCIVLVLLLCCCLPASSERCSSASSDDGYFRIKYKTLKAILAVVVLLMVLVMVIVLIKYVSRRSNEPLGEQVVSTWSGLYRFSKMEIESAMNYYREKVCLGSGSAGDVYKGVLPSGQIVAIKHIYKTNMNDSFKREVEELSKIRHPNLVCLLGCCVEGEDHYLVYEYCPNGNLAHNLLRRDSVLSWDMRLKILRNCALALRFLHKHPDGCIVHRDIKLTNILLTEDMEPKLSDFGLARMIGVEEGRVYTDVRGTIGYMDPEYISHAKLTCSSDIYSFGIVILQLLSGRKVIELDLDARETLTKKARDISQGKRPQQEFEDPRLNGNLNTRDFKAILDVAALCVSGSSNGRPNIDELFLELDRVWKNTNEKSSRRWTDMSMSSTEFSKFEGVMQV